MTPHGTRQSHHTDQLHAVGIAQSTTVYTTYARLGSLLSFLSKIELRHDLDSHRSRVITPHPSSYTPTRWSSPQVFQVTLRDLAGGLGGLHRINAYFYDDWADMYHSDLHAGDEIAVSGPAARLVRPDPSSGSGDHPFCLVFHCDAEGDDDEVTGTDLAGNAGAGQAGGGITCTVVTSAGQVSRGGPAGRGQRRRAGAGLRGGAAGRSAPGPRQGELRQFTAEARSPMSLMCVSSMYDFMLMVWSSFYTSVGRSHAPLIDLPRSA